MLTDYQLDLSKVLNDFRNAVIELATNTNDPKLWLLEQDLAVTIQELNE